MKVVALHRYAGPKSIGKRIKDPTDTVALTTAAAEMATHIPADAIIVPAPSSSGTNNASLVLARMIATLSGATVIEAVERHTAVPSSYLMRQLKGNGLSIEQHMSSMELVRKIPRGRPIIVVDNVITSGNTARAIEEIIGQEVLLIAYADAGRGTRKNPAALRVCFSGSRGFRSLDKVAAITASLCEMDKPRGSVVVVHGGAKGVDAAADKAARRCGLEVEIHNADWSKHHKAAGPIRNREMVVTCDYLYAFWDGESKGTASAIKAARDAGVDYEVIMDDA